MISLKWMGYLVPMRLLMNAMRFNKRIREQSRLRYYRKHVKVSDRKAKSNNS